jgi:predicted O-methyltransferase YrrM
MKERVKIERFAEDGFDFSEDWFSHHISLWDAIIAKYKPKKVLEIGSFEGRSTCYLIKKCVDYGIVDMVCIDTWQGGIEHTGMDFDAIEKAFDHNVQRVMNSGLLNNVDLYKLKGLSHIELAKLMVEDFNSFDLVYIDGSHMPTDVLLDATMAFKLLRVGGVLIFDDYERSDQPEYEHPQIAIDAFMKVYARKLKKVKFNIDLEGKPKDLEEYAKEQGMSGFYQMYLEKTAE